MAKKAIRKKIVDKCKKTTKCPHCKEVNGFVKKMTASKTGTGGSVLKIVHEKLKGKDKDTIVQAQLGKYFVNVILKLIRWKLNFVLAEYNRAIEVNPDIQSAISSNAVSQILTPVDVLKLFERIPEQDIPLLAMDSKK